MSETLVVDILRNGELLYRDYELDYGKVKGETVNLVNLVRNALTDHNLSIQLYVSEKRPCQEVDWRSQSLILSNAMEKTTLTRLQCSYLTINTTYRRGTVEDRPLRERITC